MLMDDLSAASGGGGSSLPATPRQPRPKKGEEEEKGGEEEAKENGQGRKTSQKRDAPLLMAQHQSAILRVFAAFELVFFC
jgi:hypothetical protein